MLEITTEDIFFSLVIICFVIGILSMLFSWMDVTSLGYISNAINQTGLPQLPAVQTLSSNLTQFSYFFPDLAALMVVVLIVQSWILSFFIKAHPLSAIMGVFSLFGYAIASFFVSNAAVSIARLALFSPIIAFSNPLLFLFLNMPPILVICGIIDIAIALTSARA